MIQTAKMCLRLLHTAFIYALIALLSAMPIAAQTPFDLSPDTPETYQDTDTAIQASDVDALSALTKAHKELLSDNSFEFDYAEPTPVKPKRFSWAGSALGEILGSLFLICFYVVCCAAIAIIGYFLLRAAMAMRVPERRAKSSNAPSQPSYRPSAAAARVLLADADALADQGHYDEAVHFILLRTIQDIRDKRPRAVPKALTSREISRLEILSDTARSAFRSIGERVENSLFGGQPLTREDYDHSRAAYESFAFEPVSARTTSLSTPPAPSKAQEA